MTINLTPQGSDSTGASVQFSSPKAPILDAGDPFVLQITAPASTVAPDGLSEVGYAVPMGTAWPTYFGNIPAGQTVQIWGTVTTAGNLSEGIGVAIGVLPPGGPFPVNPLGYKNTLFVPASAPAPPPTLGVDYLVSLVMESQFTGVPVANWRTQGIQGITFFAKPPYDTGETVTLYYGEALNDAGSAAIAAALGGSVVRVQPDPQYIQYATQVPLVNGIQATIGGVVMQAVAADVAAAFDYMLNGATALKTFILACFKAVPNAS